MNKDKLEKKEIPQGNVKQSLSKKSPAPAGKDATKESKAKNPLNKDDKKVPENKGGSAKDTAIKGGLRMLDPTGTAGKIYDAKQKKESGEDSGKSSIKDLLADMEKDREEMSKDESQESVDDGKKGKKGNTLGKKVLKKGAKESGKALAGRVGGEMVKDAAKKELTERAIMAARAFDSSAVGKAVGTGAKFMGSVKSSLSAVGSALKTGASAVGKAITTLGSNVASGIASTASYIGGQVLALSGGQLVAGAVVATMGLAVPFAVVSTVLGPNHDSRIVGNLINCEEDLDESLLGGQDAGDVDIMKEMNAQKIYAVFSTLGYPKENIAGILGNWDHESGIDSTSIEAIHDEPYKIGPKKQEAFADLDKFTQMVVFPGYDKAGVGYSKSGYKLPNGTYAPGFGLGQITGGARSQGFTDTAKAMNRNWWDFDWQLAYIIAKDSGSEWLKGYKDESYSTPEDAAFAFRKHWEGNTSNGVADTKQKAAMWYARINDMDVNEGYAKSIIALASITGNKALDGAASKQLDDCITAKKYNNSGIVSAALSLAYPSTNDSYNDGTPLYQKVKPLVMPGDSQGTKDCGRGVCTIVRWSGSDDKFPYGPTSKHKQYMMAADNWEYIGEASDVRSSKKIMPGDIVVKGGEGGSGHILVYIGKEILDQYFASEPTYVKGSERIDASLGTRSLGAGEWYNDLNDGNFFVFRLKYPEKNSKWQSVGGSVNQTGSKDKVEVK